MTTDEKINLITRNLEETLTVEELRSLIDSGTPLKHYIGFEISGKFHIGYLLVMMKVKDLQDAGAETTIYLADLHSVVNDKLGGDAENIKKIAKGYFSDGVRAIFESIGGDPNKLIFKLCSEEYASHPDFWLTFLQMAKHTTLARTKRSMTIMGREESDDSMETAKLMYPIMQAADIFMLQVNIAHAGIDQRKVHVIARDSAMQIKTYPLKDIHGNQIKPVAIHHPILLSLSAPEESGSLLTEDGGDLLTESGEKIVLEADVKAMRTKMSKSKAEGGVLIHDAPDDIRKKINQAYAPEGVIENNPVLNWTKYLVFYDTETTFIVNRPDKWGGNLEYKNYSDLERDYAEKKLHPQDLKMAVAEWLIAKLEPARRYFEDPQRKTALEEIENLTQK